MLEATLSLVQAQKPREDEARPLVYTFMTCAHSVRSEVYTTKDQNPTGETRHVVGIHVYLTCAHRSVQSEVYTTNRLRPTGETRERWDTRSLSCVHRRCDVKSLQLTDQNPTGESRHVRWDTRSSRVHITVCYWSRYNAPDQLQQEARHVR